MLYKVLFFCRNFGLDMMLNKFLDILEVISCFVMFLFVLGGIVFFVIMVLYDWIVLFKLLMMDCSVFVFVDLFECGGVLIVIKMMGYFFMFDFILEENERLL